MAIRSTGRRQPAPQASAKTTLPESHSARPLEEPESTAPEPGPAAKGTHPPRKVHLVVAGASQWGQHACAQVLHRAIGRGGRVTLIVARRFEHLFRTRRPAIKEWERYGSLEECLDDLRAAGQPIDYVFDDHLHHLAAQLLEHKREYRRLGYVVTGAEEHYAYARVLVTCCDEVLVEKPISKLVRDVASDGRFRKLCIPVDDAEGNEGKLAVPVFSCDHFMFRKGFTDARDRLKEFIERHREHELHYHFSFFETATRDALRARPAAMQDGSLLDVAIPHGLGPFVYLLNCTRDLADAGDFDGLHKAITWTDVKGFQAREREDPEAPLVVPVLAETAVQVTGKFSRRGSGNFELTIEAGKGALKPDRFVRINCRTCSEWVEKSGRPANSVFFGISLGAAGYTMCDFSGEEGGEEFARWENVFKPDPPLKALEFDGGWRSDAGGNVEAEVAQAAMLEAFIAGSDERFIQVSEACQIVRLGMEAQALAFCRRRPAYTLGHDFGSDENERHWPPQWPEGTKKPDGTPVRDVAAEHRDLKGLLCSANGGHVAKRLIEALDPVTTVASTREERPSPASCYRVLSVLGPEGFGNTDIAEILTNELKKLEKSDTKAHLIQIGRDEQWCLDRGSGTSTEDRLIHDLVVALGIGPASVKDPAADVLARIVECRADLAQERRVLILNGVDRLSDGPWQDLVALLNQLPDSHRLVFVTNRGDRAVGPVFETAELVDHFQDRPEYDPLLDTKGYREELRLAVEKLVGEISEDARKEGDWLVADVEHSVGRLAQGNITVERQLIRWLGDVVVPGLKRRSEDRKLQSEDPKKEELNAWKRAWGALAHELATLSVPRTITPFPERLLDRVSLACLAAVGETDRAAVAALARLPDGATDETMYLAFPGLAARICDQGPLHSLFLATGENGGTRYVLFPRVRRTAVQAFETTLGSVPASGDDRESGHDELKLLIREVDDRRLLLALPEKKDEKNPSGQKDAEKRGFPAAHLDRLLALGERGIHGLGKLDLDGTLMEDLCLDLVEALEIGLRGRIDLRPGRLLRLLIQSPTNLGMRTRARFLNLYAWASLSGTKSPAQIVQIMNRLVAAGRVADDCEAFEKALRELYSEPEPETETETRDPRSRDVRRDEKHVRLRVESHRNLVAADLFRTRSWFRLLGLEARSGYVFEQEKSLRDSREKMTSYFEATLGSNDPVVLRLRATLLVMLSLFRAREASDESELDKAVELTREALRINGDLAKSEADPPLPRHAAQGVCRNRLNLVLLYCLLADRAENTDKAQWARTRAAAEIVAAGEGQSEGGGSLCASEPHYSLARARAGEFELVGGDVMTPSQWALRAEQGYRRRGQEYFAELAKKYGKKLRKQERSASAERGSEEEPSG